MNARTLILLGLSLSACSSSTKSSSDTNGGTGGESPEGGSAGDVTGGSGGTTGGSAGTVNGGSDNLGGGGTTVGGSGGSIDVGGSSGAGGSTGGVGGEAGSGGTESAGGAGNFVPADYTGTPFTTLTIPGFIYSADYDSGGTAVAFCRVGAANPPTVVQCGTAKLDDWCCGNMARCDERNQPAACPVYRQDADNCGLSHLNAPEPDNYAAAQPTWVAGADGPTLTGPAVTVGMALPYHQNMTTHDDTYISYMFTGQWERYTVQVMEAGTYSIGGMMATPPDTVIKFDFEGTDITSGNISVPASPTPQTEAYHEWLASAGIGQVTFTSPGTYLMRFTLVAAQFNPLFFTFTKM